MNTAVRTRYVHWRAPTVMGSSLFVGILLAVGHHLYYASLNGKSVSGDPWKFAGLTASQQEVSIAVGTTFAFVVRAGFVIASTTAYMQLFFRTINTKAYRLSQIDKWFGSLDDIISLFRIAACWRTPLLTLVALTVWLLPIAAVISPATLSVIFAPIQPAPRGSRFVPQPAFESLAFSTYQNSANSYVQSGPAAEVSRIAQAAAASGSILQIQPPGNNATWEVSFAAPRLTCDDMDTDLKTSVQSNIHQALADGNAFTLPGAGIQSMYTFMAWSAYSNAATNDTLPFSMGSLRGSAPPYYAGSGTDIFVLVFPRAAGTVPGGPRFDDPAWDDWIWVDATALRCSVVSTDYHLRFTYDGVNQAQRIEVASMANTAPIQPLGNRVLFDTEGSDTISMTYDTWNPQYGPVSATQTVTSSSANAASFNADPTGPVTAVQTSSHSENTAVPSDLDPTGPVAAVQSTTSTAEKSTTHSTATAASGLSADETGPVIAEASEHAPSPRTAAVNSRATSITGSAPSQIAEEQLSNTKGLQGRRTSGLELQLGQRTIDPQNSAQAGGKIMRLMSYAAIQEAIMALLLGTSLQQQGQDSYSQYMYSGTQGGGDSQTPGSTQSHVFATILARTPELMTIINASLPTAEAIANATSGPAYDQAESLLLPNAGVSPGSLKDALEELYFNITISMASSELLTYDSASMFAPSEVDVTFNVYGNVWSYAADKLWLAYGIAAGITIVNVLMGMWAILATHAAFSSDFSSIVRMAMNAEIKAMMREEELPGKNPLPKGIAAATCRLNRSRPEEQESVRAVGFTETFQGGWLHEPRKAPGTVRLRQREDSLALGDAGRISSDISLLEGGERGHSPHERGHSPHERGHSPHERGSRISRDVSLLSSDDRR